MRQISICNTVEEIDKKQWKDLLKSSKHRSFFQSLSCFNFYDRLSFLESFVVAVNENDILKGVIVGYIQKDGGRIKSYLSRRAIINSGPLLASDISDEALKAILSACIKLLKGHSIYIESRNFADYSAYQDIFRQTGFIYKPHLNFQIDTSSEEVALQNMGKSRKRDIKVTLRDGAKIICSPTLSDIEQYYSVLEKLYANKIKTPLFPFEFFKKLNEEEYGKFLLVSYESKIIGGTVCVGLPDGSLYEWFACGKDGVYKNIHASTLATFAGIEYAYTHGFPIFDMMGAGKPDKDYGVREFKSKFGGEFVENGRFIFIQKPLLFRIGKLGVKLIKKFS